MKPRVFNVIILLLSSLLLHSVVCIIYTVTPTDSDDNMNSCEDNDCHNLQHYLLNVTKYFTSNTQLLFLPGLHYLHTDLIIQNVHNISLIGSTAVIQCNSTNSVGIMISNTTNIMVKDMTIQSCSIVTSYQNNRIPTKASIEILNCCSVCMQNIIIIGEPQFGIIATNVLKEFSLLSITSKGIKVYFTDLKSNSCLYSMPLQQNHTTLSIDDFVLIPQSKPTGVMDYFYFNTQPTDIWAWYRNYLSLSPSEVGLNNIPAMTSQSNIRFDSNKFGKHFVALMISLLQSTYNVSVKLSNTVFYQLYDYNVVSVTIKNCCSIIKNTISISGCDFKNSTSSLSISLIKINTILCGYNGGNLLRKIGKTFVTLQNCSFRNTIYKDSMIKIDSTIDETISDVYGPQPKMLLFIVGCIFQTNETKFIEYYGTWLKSAELLIENTSFMTSFAINKDVAITLSNVKLVLQGLIVFHQISVDLCLLSTDYEIDFYGYTEFSNIKTGSLIHGSAYFNLNIMENAYIRMSNNNISAYLFTVDYDKQKLYKFCYFQFYSVRSNSLNFTGTRRQIIEIASENAREAFNENTRDINCKFYPDSTYYEFNPLQVYSTHFIIQYTNGSNTNYLFDTGLLCKCQGTHKNCHINLLEPIYPGQTLKLQISLNSKMTNDNAIPIAVKVYDDDSPHTICKVSSLLEAEQIVYQSCTEITYNILSENTHLCKLILYNTYYEFPTVFFINLLNCPAGFSYNKQKKKCVCDESLHSELLPITECDINDQTILRPANSWISATTHNSSYTYHISSHCPFHYCLSHSSHLNFSTNNSQCQFNRSGLLCGLCQQGLSTVFGSLNCQHCSNIYLFLIILIAVIGLVFVFVLFYLNLTVTNGTINAFILYANIVSINFAIFFPQTNALTPAYTFISLANLDLGIQTCFYNGMDDYAKMWLQLAFPFYLIFIATLIIITSRYSTTIQRLTARRALPVLATLFLLSYTKILRIVSSVLFSYSIITHLPSKHTTLVWSVDANIPLFGLRFTILFIVCLILFLILVPFNVILLFTRTLSRFQFINKFKPLLDVYQAPYKIIFYNYTGLQLLMRVIFFALSSLERNINLVLGIIILSMIIGIQGITSPLITMVKNFQEILFLINLQMLYGVALYDHQSISAIAFNVLFGIAAFQFAMIAIYHIITYSCSNKFRIKVHLLISTCITRCSTFDNQKQCVSELWKYHNTRNRIPEAINYHRYRESLLIEDY